MPNQKYEAARRGWELFSAAASALSRDEINSELTQETLPEISARTYDHYRRLSRHGRKRYVPINELDMDVKAGR
jgi:hypothetical protein